MIKVFILTAHLANGFSMIPFPDEGSCLRAAASLPIQIVNRTECYPMEMIIASGSRYAPEMSPLPPRKPGRDA